MKNKASKRLLWMRQWSAQIRKRRVTLTRPGMVFCSVRNDVCTEVVVKITPCRLVKGYGRFGRTWTVVPEDEDEGRYVPDDLNLHQHGWENFTTTNCCPETSARNYQSTLHKIPKERRSHSHCVHSLKSGNYGGVTFRAISRVFSLLCCSRVCWSFQIYKNYPSTGTGQEEIGWNPSLIEAVCVEHSQLIAEAIHLSVCLANILTATNRTLQCANVAGFLKILCCVCSEDIKESINWLWFGSFWTVNTNTIQLVTLFWQMKV